MRMRAEGLRPGTGEPWSLTLLWARRKPSLRPSTKCRAARTAPAIRTAAPATSNLHTNPRGFPYLPQMPVPVSVTHRVGKGLQAAVTAELATDGPFARLQAGKAGGTEQMSGGQGEGSSTATTMEVEESKATTPLDVPSTTLSEGPAVTVSGLSFSYPGLGGCRSPPPPPTRSHAPAHPRKYMHRSPPPPPHPAPQAYLPPPLHMLACMSNPHPPLIMQVPTNPTIQSNPIQHHPPCTYPSLHPPTHPPTQARAPLLTHAPGSPGCRRAACYQQATHDQRHVVQPAARIPLPTARLQRGRKNHLPQNPGREAHGG